jgi:glycosyltransferase involved in cell wall biosynthesis
LEWRELNNANHSSSQSGGVKAREEIESRVCIVLGYYNGNQYLPEQVRSILNQSHRNLELFVSDDCSTLEVDVDSLGLAKHREAKVWLARRTANLGFANNFLDALCNINDKFGYFAFSDQDDIWHRDKIEHALAVLARYPKDMPALYCGRTALIDEAGKEALGMSPLFERPPSFENALIQNIGGGNTIVFNKAARDIIVQATLRTAGARIVSHDWWCYQLVSGAGGVVYYDPRPFIEYRQHSGNLVGSNMGVIARLIRVKDLLRGKLQYWNDSNIANLSKNRSLLAPVNQQRLDDFIKARQSGLFKRIYLFWRSGIYRQSFLGNLGLIFGVLINRV